ncbi:hypothetical protein LTR04_000029 [Oleoguttula sp. CCFEE 6159]|nr:hypothetical protein LTR04_000029 [Oleoguttula sp. CCFEE 6159]
MPSGSCFCGNVKISYSGEPAISGSTYSTNILVPEDGFEVTSGSPKKFAKTADSKNTITSYFCGDCGSTLFRDGPTFPGMKVIKVGVIDDVKAMDEAKPGVELYAPTRVAWVPEIQGADQKDGMP